MTNNRNRLGGGMDSREQSERGDRAECLSDNSYVELFFLLTVCVWRRFHEAMDSICQPGALQGGSGDVMVSGVYSFGLHSDQ